LILGGFIFFINRFELSFAKDKNTLAFDCRTQFNIRDYHSEERQKVTLVTGKVSIHGPNDAGIFLSPGQQASLSAHDMRIKNVNVEFESAWRNGLFVFENKQLVEVMQELARWYDIDVEYQGSIPQVTFFGRAYRKEKLIAILNLLKSADVSYRLISDETQKRQKLIIINKKEGGNLNP